MTIEHAKKVDIRTLAQSELLDVSILPVEDLKLWSSRQTDLHRHTPTLHVTACCSEPIPARFRGLLLCDRFVQEGTHSELNQ